MLEELLNQFLNHELLINIKGATREELKKLDDLINVTYISGEKIAGRPSKDDMFLHCRENSIIGIDKYLSFSLKACDAFKRNEPMPYINYYDLLNVGSIELNEDDLINIFLE